MKNDNMNYYKIFHTVARHKSISLAAKELYISQPAISKTIQKLEDTLNTTLFYRGAKGVSLTAEGEALYQHTAKAFASLEDGEAAIRRIQELGLGQLRIGVSTTLCKYILLPHLQKFMEMHPHIKITIECQSTYHTIKLLEEGSIDIGLVGKPKPQEHLHYDSIGMIEDIFVASTKYLERLRLREDFTSTESLFEVGNIMLLDEENITRRYINEYFDKYHITINQILEISTMDLLIDFAKTGLGVACVIREFVKDYIADQTFVELPLNVPIDKRSIGYAYMDNAPITKSMEQFIAFYRTELKQ